MLPPCAGLAANLAEHPAGAAAGIRCRVPAQLCPEAGQGAAPPGTCTPDPSSHHTAFLAPETERETETPSTSASSRSLSTAQERKKLIRTRKLNEFKEMQLIPAILHFGGINTTNTKQICCFHIGRNLVRCRIHTFSLTHCLQFFKQNKNYFLRMYLSFKSEVFL